MIKTAYLYNFHFFFQINICSPLSIIICIKFFIQPANNLKMQLWKYMHGHFKKVLLLARNVACNFIYILSS